MEWRNKTKCFYGIVIYHWRVRKGLPLSIYSAICSENCKIDQNSNLTPVKVLAAHSCKTKNWWSSTLTFPKIAFLHGGDWIMSVIRNRLHVAMGVISHRWQKTSKCDKNISDTLLCLTWHFLFLPHFDIICYLFQKRKLRRYYHVTWHATSNYIVI